MTHYQRQVLLEEMNSLKRYLVLASDLASDVWFDSDEHSKTRETAELMCADLSTHLVELETRMNELKSIEKLPI